jgi:uncharacterized protein YjbJ (UPF0337 family)
MNKDRIVGATKTVAGNIKKAVGKVVGDQKMVADGKAEDVEGKVQNAVGGIKDAIRSVAKKWVRGRRAAVPVDFELVSSNRGIMLSKPAFVLLVLLSR